MRLSFAIMSVPQRAAHVAGMVRRLAAQIDHARAAGFVVAGPAVHVDTQHHGPWASWRAAWKRRTPDATHHVVLQDDVLFCADLPVTLWRLAEARPDAMISGFLPRKAVDKAVAQKLAWVSTKRFLWAQCVMLPTPLGDEAVAWIEVREGTPESAGWKRHDDERLGAFLRARRLPVFVPVPHPVEHVGDELGSVMGHHGPAAKRRARAWLGEDQPCAHLPWSDLRHVQE